MNAQLAGLEQRHESSPSALLPFFAFPSAARVARHEIRPIRRADVPAIAKALPAAPYRTHENDLDWQRTGAITELVAWDEAFAVGAGFIHWLGPRDPQIAELLPDCPEIFRLEVVQAYRSKGIGAALVRRLEALARARGLARIGLGVGMANHRARRLYERLGYRPAAAPAYVDRCTRPGPDGEPITSEEPCIYMTKDLTPRIPESLVSLTLAA